MEHLKIMLSPRSYLLAGLCIVLFAIACKNEHHAEQEVGLEPIPDSVLKDIPSLRPSDKNKTAVLRPVVDLTDSMPPVMDQGVQFSCAAFSTTYYFLSYIENPDRKNRYMKNGRVDNSLLYSPAYVYNSIIASRTPKSNDCKATLRFDEALDFLKDYGAPDLLTAPYQAQDGKACLQVIAPDVIDKKKLHRIADYKTVSPGKIQMTIDQQHIPVMVGVFIPDSFEEDGKKAAQAIKKARAMRATGVEFVWKYAPFKPETYHAMIIVGYDELKKRFKIMNSWGTDWGDSGSFYIQYKDLLAIGDKKLFIARKDVTRLPLDKLSALSEKGRRKNKKMFNGLRKVRSLEDFDMSSNAMLAFPMDKLPIKSYYTDYKNYTDWMHPGQFSNLGGLGMGITYMNTKTGEAMLDFFEPANKNPVDHFLLHEGETASFMYKGKKVVLSMIGIVEYAKDELAPVVGYSVSMYTPFPKKRNN